MRAAPRAHGERGYAMAALLVLMAVMAIAMTAAMPVWHTTAQREKEEELIFRGQQYAHAIMLFQRKYAGTFPPDLDVLVREKFLRKKYKDPITGGDFRILSPGDPAAMQALAAAGAAVPGAAAGAAQPGLARGAAGGRGAGATQPASGRGLQGSALDQQRQQQGQTSSSSAFGQPRPLGQAAGIGASAGVMGVASKSTDKAFRLYNGRDKYNEWVFVPVQASGQAGAPTGAQTPGGGRGGAPGGRGGSPFGSSGGFGSPTQPPPPPRPGGP